MVFQKNVDNAVSYNKIQNRFGTNLNDRTTSKAELKEIEKIERLLEKHNEFDEQLQYKYDECKEMVQHGFPELIDKNGQIKDRDKWIPKCRGLLNYALNIAQIDGVELKGTTEHMENFITWEIVVRNLIQDADTYKLVEYLGHIHKCREVLEN